MQGTGREDFNAHYFRMCEFIGNVNNKQYLIDQLKAEPCFVKRNALIANLNDNWKEIWPEILEDLEAKDCNNDGLNIFESFMQNPKQHGKWLFIYSPSTRVLTASLNMLLFSCLEKQLTSYLFHISELQNYSNSTYSQDSEHSMYEYLLQRTNILALDDFCRTTDARHHKSIDTCLSSRAFNTKITFIGSTTPLDEVATVYNKNTANTIKSNSVSISLLTD